MSDMDNIETASNKAKGLFDGRFFEALDTKSAVSGGRSEYYNFYVNKDGEPYSYYKTSGVLRPDDFAAVLDHTDYTAGSEHIEGFRQRRSDLELRITSRSCKAEHFSNGANGDLQIQ